MVKMRKMKHLLQALLRWRGQRLAWGLRGREMARALEPELELVPSKRHIDLLLRFAGAEKGLGSPEISSRASTATTASSAVQEELKALRAENEKLRSRPGKLGREPSKRA